MTYFLIAGGFLAAIFSYVSGRFRGFSEGYFAALSDLSIGEPREYAEALIEDGEVAKAYLNQFGDRIDAGRKGRN
jgi:hypothetical protein